MTTKRFIINNDRDFEDIVETYELNCINDNENKTFYFIADSIENVQLFVKRLNELHEENKQLKLDKQHLHQAMSKEEVRHKQFKDNVFDLIDKSLEKDKQYYEMTYEDYLNGRIEALEELKKAMME